MDLDSIKQEWPAGPEARQVRAFLTRIGAGGFDPSRGINAASEDEILEVSDAVGHLSARVLGEARRCREQAAELSTNSTEPTAESRAEALCEDADRMMRLAFVLEEAAELGAALVHGLVERVAGEAADLLYALRGLAVAGGIPLDFAFQEVHAANMTKGPDAATKVGDRGKGPGYVPADWPMVLLRARRVPRWAMRAQLPLDLAQRAAALSVREPSGVGCAVFDRLASRVLGFGYSGPPAGAPNNEPPLPPPAASGDIHAEVNTLVKAQAPPEGSRVLAAVTRAPCLACAGALSNWAKVHGALLTVVCPMADEPQLAGVERLAKLGHVVVEWSDWARCHPRALDFMAEYMGRKCGPFGVDSWETQLESAKERLQ